MGNDRDGRSQLAELLGKDARYRLDAADAGRKDIGAEEDSHGVDCRDLSVPAEPGLCCAENENDCVSIAAKSKILCAFSPAPRTMAT